MTAMPPPPGNAQESTRTNADAFFILRDCRELFQRRLTDIARQAGIFFPAQLEAFSREIGQAHDDLAASVEQDGFEQTAGLTASRISLVGNDDLELEIRIGELVNHLKDNDRIDHWRVQLRYMTLLNKPNMMAAHNPVGLEPISRGLWALCAGSKDPIDKKFNQLERLEEQLQLQLPDVYSDLNALLEQRHIAPAAAQLVQRAGSHSAPALGGQAPHTLGNNPLSALQETLSRQFGTAPFIDQNNTQGTSNGDPAGNFALNASNMVMLNQLMDRMRTLESQTAPGLTQALDNADPDSPRRPLRAKDLDLPLGMPASIALDTLSLIFEAIFAAPDLPDAVKSAIGRLQIPLLKSAITDSSFFADSNHPARQLVNRMARAAIGLNRDSGHDHPVCAALYLLADGVRSALEGSNADLAPQLAELDALISGREHSVRASAQAYRQLVAEHEAQLSAQQHSEEWLQQVRAKTSPQEIAEFLSCQWLKVMQNAYRHGGMNGERWQSDALTAEELIWSVQPKQDPQERQKLATLIPSLLKRINTGFDLLETPLPERTRFLNTCFDLQTAALRNRVDTARSSATPTHDQKAVTGPAALACPENNSATLILEQKGLLVQYLGQTASTSQWQSNETHAKEGDWINFILPDGEALCGRHCGQESPSGTILLFNTEWGYAVALAHSLLAQQLHDGHARIASAGALFDWAAEQALGRITVS